MVAFARFLFVLIATTAVHCNTLNGTLTFTSYTESGCTGNFVSEVTLPTEECINNHDFNKVSCNLLTHCLSEGTMTYEELVNCTQAPAMKLSIRIEAYSNSTIIVHSYALSKTCLGVPIPILESVGSCSTLFAFNKDCFPSGEIGFNQYN